MSFDYSGCGYPVPEDLGALFRTTWLDLARAGNAWLGHEKVAIAGAARVARQTGEPPPAQDGLNSEVLETVRRLASDPAHTTEEIVKSEIAEMGAVKYVELVGWVSIVIAIDTFNQLLGVAPTELPDAERGETTPGPNLKRLKIRKAWVPMDGLPLPRNATSAAPLTQDAVNRLLSRMYKPADTARDAEHIRGLRPSQVEIVATTVSHGNRCFYCTLGHVAMLLSAGKLEGTAIDTLGIIDDLIDPGIKGGSQLVAMSRSAVLPEPDPETLSGVAAELGAEAAITAAEVAAGFMMINRVVEATGQPAMTRQSERMRSVIEPLGLFTFPHSGHTTERDSPSIARRLARKLRS